MPNQMKESNDCHTQTDFIVLECCKDMEIAALKKDIKNLKEENKRLQLDLLKANAIVTNIRPLFTDGQYRKKLLPERKIRWHWDDISSAICLHAAGPRAYNHLYMKGFPLPHVSTLQRWYRTVEVNEGILTAAIDLMRQNAELANDDKICVLSFDEMKVAEAFEYDQVADRVMKPSNYVQVAMARGLKKSWKQPIFFDFDCQMTVDILSGIITALDKAGFPVVAIVCDMGPTNRKLWKSLGVSSEKPWFANPSNQEEKVFVFADAPHLLKLIRNHFLDTGLVWNGKVLTPRTICDLLKYTSESDVSIAWKVTAEHLSVKGVGRQKVSLAAQVFSNTTANAIRRCYSLGKELYQPLETADMVQLVNDWFDVLNSTMRTYSYPGKEPYGLKLVDQRHVICRMNEFMSAAIIPGRKSIELFQKGVLMTNAALLMLHDYVKSKYNMEYILTNRLSQDVLENFFAAMRSKGGLNDHPTPRDFKYRLRKYILARNTEHLQGSSNVENDSTKWLGHSNQQHLEDGYSGNCKNIDTPDISEDPEVEPEAEIVSEPDAEALKDIGILHEDALEYISGYVIRKMKLDECESAAQSFTWVDQVSKGGLKKPSTGFLNNIKALESIFYKQNSLTISHCENLQQRLIARSAEIDLPDNVKRFFFKCRIYFRLRHLNRRLKVQKAKQRILGYKKFIKIKL